MRIAIVGAGGVGGYFGARLAAAGADVSFLARGAHLEAMRSKGLTIRSFKGDLHLPRVTATDDPAAIGPADIVLLLKLTTRRRDASPADRPDATVIPLKNGDGVDIVANAVGRPHTAGEDVYVAAVITGQASSGFGA
jgi:2-dehydropantoate 2-reductase